MQYEITSRHYLTSGKPFLQPYLNVQAENAIIDRILEVFNATALTAHQAKRCLDRGRVLIELGDRVATTSD